METFPLMYVDSHVNLHAEQYQDDLDAVMTRAREAGVTAMLTISDKLSSTDAIKAVIRSYPFLWRSVGVHPHYAKDYPSLTAEELVALAQEGDVVGIGECGLDEYYAYSDSAIQEGVFDAHIVAAQETALPLIIHSRDADEKMRSMLERQYAAKAFVPLLHCYTGGPALAAAALEMGGYISFSGIITFKNAEDVREIVRATPLERIIVETDCPYLAPVPKRGRRNEPAFLPHVVSKLAEIKGIGEADAINVTTQNFYRLFGKASPPSETV